MLWAQARNESQATDDPVELTEEEAGMVAGGIICSSDPVMQFCMVATMLPLWTQSGGFLCTGRE